MSQLNPNNNPIWNNLSQLFAEIDYWEIARQHLEFCTQKPSLICSSKRTVWLCFIIPLVAT